MKPRGMEEADPNSNRYVSSFVNSSGPTNSGFLLTHGSLILDQFQTLSYNSLIFGTSYNLTATPQHGLVHGAEEPKSRWTVNFQKLCDFKSLPIVENRRKNERTVSPVSRIETSTGGQPRMRCPVKAATDQIFFPSLLG